jgi:hypothetical protein
MYLIIHEGGSVKAGKIVFAGLMFATLTMTQVTIAAAINGLSISGNTSYSCEGSHCVLKADRVSNNGSVYSISGTLRLELWATDTPYAGGSISGYQIATYTLGQLSANFFFSNISSGSVAQLQSFGTKCYASLLLTHFVNGSYVIVDYVPYTNTLPGCSGGGGDPSKVAADRVFNWVEATYPTYCHPRAASQTSGADYYRYYSGTGIYLFLHSNDFWAYVPPSGWLDLGPMSDWVGTAAYYGY